VKRVAPAAGAAASRPAASAAAKARDNQVMMGKDGTAARLSAREGNTVVPTRSRMGSCGRWGDLVAERKASDLFVECLETEGVKYVFGIPGEETLDLNESLDGSSIAFVPVRHEQGGAYMADMYGRLTQRAGVCLGTLGPGATNLVTGVADAFLDHAPLVALTGQADLERMHKESHQHIDVVSMLRPVTKWNARLSASQIIPEVVRKAFKVAQAQKPGATHIELPEDVMGEQVTGEPLPAPLRSSRVEPSDRELLRAAEVIRAAANPIVLAGNGVARNRAAPALREFARTTGIGVAETFMGKGALDFEDPHALGTVGHVSMLRRTQAGPFGLEAAISLDKLTELAMARDLEQALLPLTAGLDDIPALPVTPGQARLLRQGRKLAGIAAKPGLHLATDRSVPVALVECSEGELRVVRGFNL